MLVLFYDVYYIKKSPFWEEAHVTKFAVIVCVLFTKQWKFHGNVTDFGGDRVHLVYDYPNYGDNVPFVYEKSPSVVNESGELYKAKLGRISAYNRYSYEGVARIKFQFSESGLPNTVKASFLFDSDESGLVIYLHIGMLSELKILLI